MHAEIGTKRIIEYNAGTSFGRNTPPHGPWRDAQNNVYGTVIDSFEWHSSTANIITSRWIGLSTSIGEPSEGFIYFTFTRLTLPSLPQYTSVTNPGFHWFRCSATFRIITTSPTFMLRTFWCHLGRSNKAGK